MGFAWIHTPFVSQKNGMVFISVLPFPAFSRCFLGCPWLSLKDIPFGVPIHAQKIIPWVFSRSCRSCSLKRCDFLWFPVENGGYPTHNCWFLIETPIQMDAKMGLPPHFRTALNIVMLCVYVYHWYCISFYHSIQCGCTLTIQRIFRIIISCNSRDENCPIPIVFPQKPLL